MEPQISLFNNFFIKNGFYGTIHTFKNYFTIIFFSFQFQFSIFSCIKMKPNSLNPLIGYDDPYYYNHDPDVNVEED